MATYSPADYELLRRRCATLKEQNWPQVKIAQALGMTEEWVSQALKSTARTASMLAQLVTELTKGAVTHGFEGKVWTRQRINAVLYKLFGVSYDPSQVGRPFIVVKSSKTGLASEQAESIFRKNEVAFFTDNFTHQYLVSLSVGVQNRQPISGDDRQTPGYKLFK